MSETQLERIADALETIAAHLTGNTPVKVVEAVNEIITPDTIEVETKDVTIDDIKNKLIEINRDDNKAKPKLKALLGEFDAVRASDLKEDDFKEVMHRLETGGY